MKRVLLASNNAHKVAEFRQLFELHGVSDATIYTPSELGIVCDPPEDAPTYAGNALRKARAFAAAARAAGFADLWVLADDSGLEVEALGGRPGVHSARYHHAAPNGDGCAALLHELRDVPTEQRHARFRCVLAAIGPDSSEQLVSGTCEGFIAPTARGQGGFGFDPVFIPRGETRTLAEMTPTEKHRISHRGAAIRALLTAWAQRGHSARA